MADTVKAVYVGWVTLESEKPGAALNIVNEDGSLGRELVFERKVVEPAIIGGMYEIPQTGERSYVLNKRRYVGMYHDEARILEWQLARDTKRLYEEAAKMESSDKKVPAALEAMEPIRRIYQNSLPMRRRALEVILLNYLRQ